MYHDWMSSFVVSNHRLPLKMNYSLLREHSIILAETKPRRTFQLKKIPKRHKKKQQEDKPCTSIYSIIYITYLLYTNWPLNIEASGGEKEEAKQANEDNKKEIEEQGGFEWKVLRDKERSR